MECANVLFMFAESKGWSVPVDEQVLVMVMSGHCRTVSCRALYAPASRLVLALFFTQDPLVNPARLLNIIFEGILMSRVFLLPAVSCGCRVMCTMTWIGLLAVSFKSILQL
jgi:hypothetical protein